MTYNISGVYRRAGTRKEYIFLKLNLSSILFINQRHGVTFLRRYDIIYQFMFIIERFVREYKMVSNRFWNHYSKYFLEDFCIDSQKITGIYSGNFILL